MEAKNSEHCHCFDGVLFLLLRARERHEFIFPQHTELSGYRAKISVVVVNKFIRDMIC